MSEFTPSSQYSLLLRRKIRQSKLPIWCIRAIRYLAWEQGHSAGQSEVDMLALEWLGDFERTLLDPLARNAFVTVPFNVLVHIEGESAPRSVQVHGEDEDDAAVAAVDFVAETAFVGSDRVRVVKVDFAYNAAPQDPRQ